MSKKLTARERAMIEKPYPEHKSYKGTTLTPQERAADGNSEQYLPSPASYASAESPWTPSSYASAESPWTPSSYASADSSRPSPASYASADSPSWSLKSAAESPPSWLSPELPYKPTEPIDWFQTLKPPKEVDYSKKTPKNWYEQPEDDTELSPDLFVKDETGESPHDFFKKHTKASSNWKKLSMLVRFTPLFKKDEKKLDTALLEIRTITNEREAMQLLRESVTNIRFIHPSIYTPEMLRMVIDTNIKWAIFIEKDHPLVRKMFEQIIAEARQRGVYSTICEYWNLDDYLEERHLYDLNYRSRFKISDIKVTDVLYLHALCHGGLLGPMPSPQTITRYSSIPLGVCEKLASITMASIRSSVDYSNFITENVKHMKTLIDRTHYSEGDLRYVAVKKLGGVVPKKTFLSKHIIMNKMFSCIDTTDTKINFLDIVTRTGKFNLFSLKTEWSLEEIASLFKGVEIVLCDYSCSPNEGFSQEVLETTGGTKRKRAKRRKTKRF